LDVFGVGRVALLDIYFLEVMYRHGQISTDDLDVDDYFFVLGAREGVPIFLIDL
jgi:hypothetical protein